MTKKQKKEQNNSNRVFFNMNTGTRTHKTKKDYNRKENKQIWENMVKIILPNLKQKKKL